MLEQFKIVNWLVKRSYFSTPSFNLLASLIFLLIFNDQEHIVYLLISLLFFLLSILKAPFLMRFLIFIIYFITYYILSNLFIPYSQVDKYFQASKLFSLCGYVQDINKTNIRLFHVSINSKLLSRYVSVKINNNDYDSFGFKVKRFEFICFDLADTSFLKLQRRYFDYVLYYKPNFKVRHYTNFLAVFSDKLSNYVNFILDKYLDESSSLFKSIIFGIKDDLGKEEYELFKNLGLAHVLVASGANVLLIVGFLDFMFKKVLYVHLALPKYISTSLYLIVLLGYLIIVGLEGSLTRAILFWFLSFLSWWRGYGIHNMHKILLSSAIIGIFLPSLFFSLNYIFSISAVFLLFMAHALFKIFKTNFNDIMTDIVSSILITPFMSFIVGYFFKIINFTGIVSSIIFLPLIQILIYWGFSVFILIFILEVTQLSFIVSLMLWPVVELLKMYIQAIYRFMELFSLQINNFLIFKDVQISIQFLIFLIIFLVLVYLYMDFYLYESNLQKLEYK